MKKTIFFLMSLCFTTAHYVHPAGPTIAVSEFQNLTGDSQYDWVGMSFSESLYTQLGKTKGLHLIERAQLSQIFSEMKIQLSGAVDEKTFIEAGKLFGAKNIIVGSISKVKDRFLVNSRLLETETGSILKTAAAPKTLSIPVLLQ